MRFLVGTATAQSITQLPTGARVLSCRVEVTTPYSLGATIQVGQTGDEDRYQTPAQNVAQVAHTYIVDQDTEVLPGPLEVKATILGAPLVGAATVIVIWVEAVDP